MRHLRVFVAKILSLRVKSVIDVLLIQLGEEVKGVIYLFANSFFSRHLL